MSARYGQVQLALAYGGMNALATAVNINLYSDSPWRDAIQTGVTGFFGTSSPIVDFVFGEAIDAANELDCDKSNPN